MNGKIVYRICEIKKGKLLTLFHGINRSRELKIEQWHKAVVKPVTDGNRKTSKVYKSGFHSLATIEETRIFAKKFRAPRYLCIVKCEIKGETWDKEHSPVNIILSEWLKPLEVIEKIDING